MNLAERWWKWAKNGRHRFKAGDKFSIQPALNYKGSLDAPGYSFRYIGGNATYVIIPNEVMEMDCLLPYQGDSFFLASLSEPMSCVIGAFHASYHTRAGSYVHEMGIREGGNLAILAGAGPMGLGAIDYAIHCDRKPGLMVVTDIDDARLQGGAKIHTVEEARKHGIELHYVNTRKHG
jgi:L-sorbose 1-phosphate reductase